jgi:predicted metalloprotease with PDZ domain
MKQLFFGLLVIFSASSFAQEKYKFYMDLNKINNDLIQVTLEPPAISKEKIIYNIPKIVPGTYQIYDFGQYVMDFQAFDKEGKVLYVNRLDDNRWEIHDADKLGKISYWVEDTWDAEVEELVFEPGGTNIEEGENIVLNNHGFFGYFDDMKLLQYELNITRPDNFYGSTGLTDITTKENTDTYTIGNYMDLVDSPIMYNQPDTVTFKIAETSILVSVYSKNKVAPAAELAKDIKVILEAQKEYLGGKLPVEKYAFIIYLYEGTSGSGGSGALEHSYSSFYYLPEMDPSRLSGFLVDVAAHEFFHIVTPLNIHSEEIGNFDFIHPKMSKHLWLYEGVTEYFAGHVQVYQGLISTDAYFDMILDKMETAENFNDTLPFTVMSAKALDEHKDEYMNVYNKGALIGLCLDILIREQTNGKKGLKELMHLLSQEYGKDVSFKDDELFSKISQLISPELSKFFATYVEGSQPLPFEEIFAKVGVDFKRNVEIEQVGFGGVALGFNMETQRLFVMDNQNMNKFGKKLKIQVNDEILAINGTPLTVMNFEEVITNYQQNTNEGDKISMLVERVVKGEKKQVELKAKAIKTKSIQDYYLAINPNATEQQIQLRKTWLGQ